MTLVYLNVGSNTARTDHICAGLDALQAQFGALELSSVYESEALGFSGDRFYNLAVAVYTDMPVVELASWLRQLEYSKGREPGAERFSPRNLDIDILCYADKVGCIAGVELPRPEILENAHVLGPLAELVPTALHPVAGLCYAQLWADYASRQNVWRVDFEWQDRQISSAET
ncbi:MAG: 2-amino-4-hydroxy-6-hydroxymethyldihydropteridine diphosphokinase [Gammaproteobacteria bacterium]|nr:2-amino-4-hydroxy-6-hydroxymethyldihydropteridine diphosphokinase [Gammaproteobacteria bacterium]